jgi:transcriptional regulator with XRE-family HTH domain
MYPFEYTSVVSAALLERVRHEAGLSQEELAARAGTSRTTLSAYERGRKSPTLATVERLLDSAGFELTAQPHVTFSRSPHGAAGRSSSPIDSGASPSETRSPRSPRP